MRKNHSKGKIGNSHRKKPPQNINSTQLNLKNVIQITLKLFSGFVAVLTSLLQHGIFLYILLIKQRYLLEQHVAQITSLVQRKEAQMSLWNTPCFCVNGRYNICLRHRCRIPIMGAGRSQQMPYICSHSPHSFLVLLLGCFSTSVFLDASWRKLPAAPQGQLLKSVLSISFFGGSQVSLIFRGPPKRANTKPDGFTFSM